MWKVEWHDGDKPRSEIVYEWKEVEKLKKEWSDPYWHLRVYKITEVGNNNEAD